MSVYDGIMTGLNEVIEYERGNLKVKTRTVRIIPPKTVEAWEAGRNHPDGSSSRMLQLLQKDPDLIQIEGLMAIE